MIRRTRRRIALFSDFEGVRSQRSGLALVELIFSVGLILIIGAVVFWAINPLERACQVRDQERLSALSLLREAIDASVSGGVALGSTFGVNSSTVGVDVSFRPDGSGWIPMDLSPRLSDLPRDPRNGETFPDVLQSKILGEYQFISDGKYYVLRTHLEAEVNRAKYAEDGNDNTWYEVGSASGLSTYFGL